MRVAFLFALASIAVAGCGGSSGPERLPVSGTVTLDGKPLESGRIVFAPVEGTTAAAADIADGAFRIDRTEGPSPGSYQVEIISVKSTGKTVRNPDFPGETIEETRNVVPPRYNAKTELKVEVKADGSNSFPFVLTSVKPAARGVRR